MILSLCRVVVRQRTSVTILPALVIVAVLALGAIDVHAQLRTVTSSAPSASLTKTAMPAQRSTDVGPVDVSMAPVVAPIVAPSVALIGAPIVAHSRDLSVLAAAVQQSIASSGGSVGVSLIELGGSDPVVWSVNASDVFTAASTYKLAALMLEAQNIAAGTTDPNGLVCFQADDYEYGWFDDYSDGACYTRNELAVRAGMYSDNTAGHMLVRDVGGADALNAWAASIGATNSAFEVGNTTTAADLATLWLAEAQGRIGGAAAQAWLYPLLTDTRTESGVPAGVSDGAVVVHKTGTIDQVVNDAALVTSGPHGSYVVVVMTDGLGGDAGWQLIATISAEVWKFEVARSQ
ncbi:MAG TPA: serine hydrolase [Candidatus Dormibacteraeota bacterium]|nr:serine hydrolase [Candidatus Dormibacteraeota bacterium]